MHSNRSINNLFSKKDTALVIIKSFSKNKGPETKNIQNILSCAIVTAVFYVYVSLISITYKK